MLPLLAAALLVQDPPPDPPAPPGVGIELPDGRFILNGNARTVGEALEALRNPTGGISMSDLKKKAEGEGPEAEAAKAEYERLISGKLTESPGTAGPTIGRTIRLQWGDPNLPPELRRAVPGQLFGPLVRPRLPSDPLVGALKLTAPDGTVTEYRAEFTPDPPPAPETPPKYRLGIAIDGFEPKGDPPGLVIGKVVEDSPAAKAGIEDRDRVISVGGEPLPSFRVLRVKVAEAAEKGEPLVVKVVRGEGRPDDAAAADAAEAGGDAKVRAVRILQFNIKPEEAPEEDDGEPIIRRLNADAERPFSFDIPVDTRRFQFGPATILSAEDLGLTPQVAEVRVRAAEAQVRAAEAQVEALRANADRQSRLVDAGVQSARKRDEAAAKLAAAEAGAVEGEVAAGRRRGPNIRRGGSRRPPRHGEGTHRHGRDTPGRRSGIRGGEGPPRRSCGRCGRSTGPSTRN